MVHINHPIATLYFFYTFRFLANYEYAESSVTFLSDILLHSESEKEMLLTVVTIGKLVTDCFGGKVKRVKRGPKTGTRKIGYLNLGKKVTPKERHQPNQEDMNSDNIIKFTKLPVGWYPKKNGPNQVSFIRFENWEFAGRRVILELALTRMQESGDWEFVLKSHGSKVILSKEELGIQVQDADRGAMFPEQQLQLTLEFLETSATCKGMLLGKETVIATIPHSSGTYMDLKWDSESGEEQRAFALDCKIAVNWMHTNNCCTRCAKLIAASRTRTKRKETQRSVSVYTNKRFLTKEEVLQQLNEERIAKHNAINREKYWR